MKKIFLFGAVLLFAAACNNSGGNTTTGSADSTGKTAAATEPIEYPYTLDSLYKDWQPGDQKNAVLVMKMLKAFETKNATECASYFGDSVNFTFDYYDKKLPHDSIASFVEDAMADYASINIKMQDWESVISKDKKEEWVTLWYKQSWLDKKGKADSIKMINDAKIENGKIVVFDEKIQHFPTTKK
jgi:hypothetical protein